MRSAKLILILLFAVFYSCEKEPEPTATLALSVTPAEGGIINYSPKNNSFTEGQIVTLTPEPNENWVFQKWEGDANGTTHPLTIKMDSNKSIVGVFVRKNFALNYIIIGEGTVSEAIVVNPSGREFPHGTTVELTPVPKEGWVFESWGGDLSGNKKPERITVDGEKTVTVRFVPKPQGEPIFYLSDNGITCKCENVIAGDKGFINGVEFEAVNNDLLRLRLAEKKDMTKLCTSLVTDMSSLFQFSYFNQPIGNWDVSKVSDMSEMFHGSTFNQSIGAWNVSKVTNMQDMFAGGLGADGFYEAYFNHAIGEWDVSNVTKMDRMFSKNTNFNQDLSKWCVAKIPTIPNDFTNSAWTLPKPVWGTCPD